MGRRLELDKWADGKVPALAMVAQELALGAEDLYEWIKATREEPGVLEGMRRPWPPEWLALYDDERRVVQGFLESVTRVRTAAGEKGASSQETAQRRLAVLKRRLERVQVHKARLLDLRLEGEADQEVFASKQTELRDREAHLVLEIEAAGRQQSERSDVAVRAFELSQALGKKWLAAEIAEKRELLEIICLNWTLDGVTLCPEMRKPFDVIAEGLLLPDGRGAGI